MIEEEASNLEGNLKISTATSVSFNKIKQLEEKKVSSSSSSSLTLSENNNLKLSFSSPSSKLTDNSSASTFSINETKKEIAFNLLISAAKSSKKCQSNNRMAPNWLSFKNARNPVIFLLLLMSFMSCCFCQNATKNNLRPIRRAKLLETNKYQSLLVQTKNGLFKGIYLPADDGKSSDTTQDAFLIGFLGIRYASAPVKRLRFMPPSAYHYAPNQVYNMQRFGPICKQRWPVDVNHMPTWMTQDGYSKGKDYHSNSDSSSLFVNNSASAFVSSDSIENNLEMQLRLMKGMMSRESFAQFRPLFEKLSNREQSEDCLNLNIYMPLQAIPGKSELPVLVMIHGESFDYGAGSSIDPSKFIYENNNKLIVITFNFRLNILGFPPKLAGASRGNLGLLDQVAALHWIKDNINSFGGSPNNITLMGSKKGAIFVNLLALSPMAKGLFQRAIMEDGSALTPLVANQLTSSGSQHLSSVTTTTTANLRSIQHVHFLAKICDCPLTTAAPSEQQQPLASSTTSADNNNASSSSVVPGLSSQQLLAASTFMSLSDETHKMNALTFECLRHKPIEQIMLHIPLHLIRLNHTTGQLHFEQNTPHLYQQANSSGSSYSQPIVVDTSTLSKLFLQAHIEKLSSHKVEGSLANELFNAIYTSPPQTLKPLFGPTCDGAIVPTNEDLAELMLKRASPFTQRDLLLGLTQPLTPRPWSNNRPFQEIQPNHLMADLISPSMQREGLTNEQALDLVNTFVRSFYRYHSQEITNSIVNHYLTHSSRPARKFHFRERTSKLVNDSLETNNLSQDPKVSQQLFILNSLLDAFQDALTIVPVLKTGFIHANRQLDLLFDPFVGQQFENWKKYQNDTTSILESFISFSQTLLNHPNWPLELHSQTNQVPPQAKSTYFYQFDLNQILFEIYKVTSSISETASLPERIIRETLLELADSLQTPDFKYKINFNCIWNEFEEEKRVADVFNKYICSRLGSVLFQFVSTGRIANKQSIDSNQLISFSSSDVSPIEHFESECLNLRENSTQNSEADHDSVLATGALRTSNFPEIIFRLSETCKLELNKLSLTYLVENSDSSSKTYQSVKTWKTFNPFSQQVATLPAISQHHNELWKVNHILDETDDGDDNQANNTPKLDHRYSLMARSSFWSNFIPALNCSKTQPIIPSSLLSSPLSLVGGSNSSLLTLNLFFSCQQGGTTSYGAIESLADSAQSQLNMMIERWKLANRSHIMIPAAQQNHHSLRMANMSNKVSQYDSTTGNQQIDAQQEPSIANSETNLITNTEPNYSVDLRAKFTSLNLVISSALLVALTTLIVSTGCYLVKVRQKQGRSRDQTTRKLSAQAASSSSTTEQSQQIIQNSNNMSVCNSTDQNQSSSSDGLAAGGFVSGLSPLTGNFAQNNDLDPQQQQQQNLRVKRSPVQQHVCTLVDSNDPNYIYWPQEHNDKQHLFDSIPTTTGICRSHSSFNVTSGSEVFATLDGKLHLSNGNNNTSSINEPIMVPLQGSLNATTSSNHSATLGGVKDSTNRITSGLYTLDSSSESTQIQSVVPPPKKRVKIHDPLANSKRANTKRQTDYQDTRIYDLSIPNSTRTYCPMHRSQSNSSTLEPQYIVESSFQQPELENQLELWEGNFSDGQHHVPSILNNSNYLPLDIDSQSAYMNASQDHHCVHSNLSSLVYLPQSRVPAHNINSLNRDLRYHNH